MSPLTLRQTILRVLAQNEPYPVPAETLFGEVNRLVRPAITPEVFRTQLSWMLDRDLVAFLPDDIDPENVDARRWLIKEAGAAALSK